MALRRFARSVTLAAVSIAAVVHAADPSGDTVSPGRGVGAVTFVEAFSDPQPRPATAARRVTAVGMRADALPASEASADVVVLVDTSASQTGEHRSRSFDVVRGLFAGARAEDRLRVAAIDSFFLEISPAFAAPDERHLEESLDRLDQRTPLGASDVIAGLRAAAGFFAEGGRPKAIVYVGDGPNWAGVDAAEFAALVDQLRARRIPVSVAGVGPDVNWPLLAALANQTGGVVIVPAADEKGMDVGRSLAERAVRPVAWPVEPPPADARAAVGGRVLPTRLPPLRDDRESIILIGGEATGLDTQFSFVSGSGAPVPVRVLVPEIASKDANAFLATLFENANPTDGLFLPLLGSAGLEAARAHLLAEADSLAEMSRQAEDTGMRDSAIRLAEASLRRNPDNPVAKRVRTVALQAAPAPATEEVAAPPRPLDPPGARNDGTLAEDAAMRRVRGQQLEQETAVLIREARQLLSSDPDGARTLLQRSLNDVRDSTDLDAAARERLSRQLEMRIRESIVRSREKMDRDIAAERKAAIGREQARLNDSLRRREDRLKQLVERYNALIDEGIRDGYAGSERYPKSLSNEWADGFQVPTRALTDAERQLGDEIGREAPQLWAGHPMPMPARALGRTAGLVARTLDYDAENFRTRRDHERGFMDTLHLVDVAAIPLPDEPSIIYPTAERWREINALRAEYRKPALNTLNANEQRIYDALEEQVRGPFEFNEDSLESLVAKLGDPPFNIPVVIDLNNVVTDQGLDVTAGILTRKPGPASLRSALRQLLAPIDLTYMIKNDALVITTKKAVEDSKNLTVRPYAVGDLVLPVDPMNAIDPFNLGGATRQQQNQPINPGAPPGPVCWVAREVFGVHDPRWLVFRDWVLTESPAWFRESYVAHGEAWAEWLRDKPAIKGVIRMGMIAIVNRRGPPPDFRNAQWQVAAVKNRVAGADGRAPAGDGAAAGNEPADPSPRPAAPSRQPPARGRLPRDVTDAADIAAALNRYLAADSVPGDAAASAADGGPDAAALGRRLAQLRETAAELGAAGQFGKAAELISAAIRTGHAEPWMYESLALAMEAAGGSPTEIARTLLSSEDFATTPADLLALAKLLARMDFETKALDLCRKIVRIDPMNREAFALAMTIASRNDDLLALTWACPGVLAVDWPAKHRDIAVRASRLAKTTMRRFEETGRQSEADALKAAVEAASVRDLVIQVTWSGDAELDVRVEEPAGTVCCAEVPRTQFGGTLIGTDVGNGGTPTQQRCYSAAAAFPGTYRVRLRKLFGSIDADTVEVVVTAHRGTPAERTETQRIPLSTADHYLQVDLGEGRRREALPEAQLAQDVVAQRAIGKTVLMRQLELLAEESTGSEFAASRAAAAEAGGTAGLPFFGNAGRVGYQPIITTLPEGLNHSARVVISPDRRYVRVTCTPFFSGVGQVTTFSFQGSGAGGGNTGGGGGLGGGGLGGGGLGGGGLGGGGLGGGGLGGGGGGLGGGGGGFGGGGQNICWVAREVYGDDDPRWRVFRGWLLAEAPAWLLEGYRTHGAAMAAWLHGKPAARMVVRGLMDAAIAGRDVPPAGP